jgi:hypothetical protein
MPLDATETAALAESVKGDAIPDFLKPVADAGYTILSPAAKTAFENNFKTSVITERDRELYGTVEATVKEVSGVDKNSGEKATDYLKRAFGSMNTELTELRDAKKNGTLSAVEKQRLTQLETAVAGHNEAVDTLKKEHSNQMLSFRVGAETGAALNNLKGKLKAAYKEGDLFSDIQAAKLAQFERTYKPEEVADGNGTKIVFRDVAKNTVALNQTGAFATAGELLEGMFANYIEKAPTQPGGGSPPPGGGAPGGGGASGDTVTKDTYQPGAEVKTRVALSDDLKKSGFKAGTVEFSELLTKFGKDLPLR